MRVDMQMRSGTLAALPGIALINRWLEHSSFRIDEMGIRGCMTCIWSAGAGTPNNMELCVSSWMEASSCLPRSLFLSKHILFHLSSFSVPCYPFFPSSFLSFLSSFLSFFMSILSFCSFLSLFLSIILFSS